MSKPWDFEGYWNVVLGANRSAANVVREFGLIPATRHGLDEWLGTAEAEALAMGGVSEIPAEWSAHHARALDMLCAVVPMATATLTELATENAYENRLTIIETIARACYPLRSTPDGIGTTVERLERRERAETLAAYAALLAVMLRIKGLAPAAERDDAAASYEVQLLVLLDRALLISIARSPAEIVTLAEEAEERMLILAGNPLAIQDAADLARLAATQAHEARLTPGTRVEVRMVRRGQPVADPWNGLRGAMGERRGVRFEVLLDGVGTAEMESKDLVVVDT